MTNKSKIIISTIIIAVLAGGYLIYRTKAKGTAAIRYVTTAAAKDTLVVSVTGTGQVEASDQIDVKPQTDGRLIMVNAKQNQQVKKGDILAVVDQQSAANSVAQARANLQQAQANYDKLMAGATQNQIETQNLSIQSAQQALNQAKANLQTVTDQQSLAVAKAFSNLLNADLQAIPSDSLSTATVTLSGSYTGTAKGQYSISLYLAGDGLHYSVSGLGSVSGIVNRGFAQPLGNGLYVTFGAAGVLSPSTSWTIDLPNPQSNNYVNNQNAYNSALQNQTQAVTQAQNSIASAQNTLDKANLSYQSIVQPPTAADIASAKAQITSAQAQLANAQTAYDNTILRAPFDGVIASVGFSVGDKVTAGSVFATVITPQQIAKIALNEVDVAKVKLGQKATFTFDAIDGLQLTGSVAQIDTLGTVSQGVVSYNVKVAMDTQDDRIKPGMSVSVAIITDVAQDVLTVPNSAVRSGSSGSYVQVLDLSGKPQNVLVQTGLANDTMTEVNNGLSEGQEVVTQTINPNITVSSQSNSSLKIPGITGGGGNATFIGSGGTVRIQQGGGGRGN